LPRHGGQNRERIIIGYRDLFSLTLHFFSGVPAKKPVSGNISRSAREISGSQAPASHDIGFPEYHHEPATTGEKILQKK